MLKRKKPMVLAATVMMMTLTVSATAFASPLLYDSEEGIGIEVEYPASGVATRSITQGDKVSVSGGKLWVTWKDGVSFRANYDHSSKTHRCSVTNDHLTLKRSAWESKGITAISPWLDQTFTNNKAYAATK